jgi:hypothetical protein
MDDETKLCILNRAHKYKIDISSDIICTKCLKNHDRKYCDIYHEYLNNYNDDSYYEYLNKISNYEKNNYILNKCNKSVDYLSSLELFTEYTLFEKVFFIKHYDDYPIEMLIPFYNVMYAQHSEEDIRTTLSITS